MSARACSPLGTTGGIAGPPGGLDWQSLPGRCVPLAAAHAPSPHPPPPTAPARQWHCPVPAPPVTSPPPSSLLLHPVARRCCPTPPPTRPCLFAPPPRPPSLLLLQLPNSAQSFQVWSKVLHPTLDIDILVTHAPPFGCDRAAQRRGKGRGKGRGRGRGGGRGGLQAACRQGRVDVLLTSKRAGGGVLAPIMPR